MSLQSTSEDDRSPIIVEDDALRGGFTQTPNEILKRTDISTGAKPSYMGLLSFAWQGTAVFLASHDLPRRSVYPPVPSGVICNDWRNAA